MIRGTNSCLSGCPLQITVTNKRIYPFPCHSFSVVYFLSQEESWFLLTSQLKNSPFPFSLPKNYTTFWTGNKMWLLRIFPTLFPRFRSFPIYSCHSTSNWIVFLSLLSFGVRNKERWKEGKKSYIERNLPTFCVPLKFDIFFTEDPVLFFFSCPIYDQFLKCVFLFRTNGHHLVNSINASML